MSGKSDNRIAKTYKVKEMFYSLQGEGARSGRAAVFCRFSKCNLWTGREQDRKAAVCNFCDTDIVGTDGQNGGIFTGALALVDAVTALWPDNAGGKPYVICTGGEPALQLDEELISCFHDSGFEVGIETNGTLPLPNGLDWICVSPKGSAQVVVEHCNELKLVYPQALAPPERFQNLSAENYFLSPMASPNVADSALDAFKQENTRKALEYCLVHPQWRLTLQMHKLLGID
nr:7-carboxy-7-deazaguanine synthase [Oleiphilus messinensis]